MREHTHKNSSRPGAKKKKKKHKKCESPIAEMADELRKGDSLILFEVVSLLVLYDQDFR